MCLLQPCFLLKQKLPLTSVRSGFPCCTQEVRCEPSMLRLACWGWQRSPTLQRMIQVGNTVVLLSGWSNYSFMKLCEATALTKGRLSPFPKAELWDPGTRGTSLGGHSSWWLSLLRCDASASCRTGRAWFLLVPWLMLDPSEPKGEPGSFFCLGTVIRSPSPQTRCPFSWRRETRLSINRSVPERSATPCT